MRTSWLRSALISAAIGAVLVSPAVAQDGISPNPEDCNLTPRVVEEMQALHGTPAPEGEGEAVSALEATPVDFELPTGEPADEETTAEIVAAITSITACYNAGDYLAGMGALTDEFILVQVGQSLFDEDFVAAMNASPVALEEDQQTVVLDVREVIVLDDGRVAALFDYHSPTPQIEGIDGVETDLFIFVDVDGAWLLDEVVENVEGTHGPIPAATPAA